MTGLIPRTQADSVEKLLGKRGTVKDRHALAREDWRTRLGGIRHALRMKRSSWDEVTQLVQLVVRGVQC